MRRVFVDTVFWIAVLDPGDSLHRTATSALDAVAGAHVIMRELRIVEALTFDSDFIQAGFQALLRQ